MGISVSASAAANGRQSAQQSATVSGYLLDVVFVKAHAVGRKFIDVRGREVGAVVSHIGPTKVIDNLRKRTLQKHDFRSHQQNRSQNSRIDHPKTGHPKKSFITCSVSLDSTIAYTRQIFVWLFYVANICRVVKSRVVKRRQSCRLGNHHQHDVGRTRSVLLLRPNYGTVDYRVQSLLGQQNAQQQRDFAPSERRCDHWKPEV